MLTVAGSSVNIQHNIKVTFQNAESSVCTAAHSQKFFGIFDFILDARRPSLGPTHPSIQWAQEALFRGIKVAGFGSDRDALTYTQHGYRHIYIRLNRTLLPEHASQERKPSKQCLGYWVQRTGKYEGESYIYIYIYIYTYIYLQSNVWDIGYNGQESTRVSQMCIYIYTFKAMFGILGTTTDKKVRGWVKWIYIYI